MSIISLESLSRNVITHGPRVSVNPLQLQCLVMVAGKHSTIQENFSLNEDRERRVCPGRHFALNSVWALAASVVAVFDFLKPIDEDGNEREVHVELIPGFVR